MRILKLTLTIILFIFLTVLTQVGGVIYLISSSTHKYIDKWFTNKGIRWVSKLASFLILYSIASFYIVPIIAKPFGRVALPLTRTDNLQPLNFLTCLLNRHYVRPELKQTTIEIAGVMNRKFPGTVVNYLDANFPFINGFPLVPHLSHNDGKKLDIAFCYIENESGKPSNDVPSIIGYGISEEPRANEVNTANLCANKGSWQYTFLMKVIPQSNKSNFSFDSTRTRELVNHFAAKSAIGKIFIEPHLKTRLKLTNNKIRFHGCQAVRHDDHIHVQLL